MLLYIALYFILTVTAPEFQLTGINTFEEKGKNVDFLGIKNKCDITKDRENRMKRKLEWNKNERKKMRCY